METMLASKQKEAVMEVRRQLVEAASKENLPIKMCLGRVTPEQLCSYVQLFKSSWGGSRESLWGAPAGPGHRPDPPPPHPATLGHLPGFRETAAAGSRRL
ncbi:sec1 family domain-containing protein 2-like [Oncorhynchus tshawytscha]|uniref:sec1 family domain-containing protein 2-like n=1 Tax=Oncorhynchus tshawytscha TaxID=74940 RepID=UPI000D0997EA|nr:sec1 family domain-containing protein 2-like [Oncorhynchus tshawytscha]XP_042176191.1 sec1 family domain-containing protein 2-like [Oncorhynchus tshawytscha]